MKKLLVVLAMLVAMNAHLYSQNEWHSQNSNTTNELRSIQFIDINIGYIVGGNFSQDSPSGVILKTTNSGVNWIIQKTTYPALRKIFFINANTGWAVGGSYPPLYGHPSRILLKTVNGGLNWIELINDTQDPAPLNSLYFIDSLTGFFGSYNVDLLKTTNGGNNFTTLNTNEATLSIKFIDNNTGFFAGNPIILITTNAGNNWTLNFYDPTININDLIFIGKNYGYAVGHGTIIKTTNGGMNWTRLIHDYTSRNNVFFVDSLNGWVSYSDFNKLMKTTNGGINWVDRYIQNGTYIGSVYFVNKNTGWVCGSNGTIFKTTTGGEPTGIIRINNETPSKFSLGQSYPNPFNSMCNVQFSMCNAGYVKLVVYDVQGREVQTLVNERLQPGTYEAAFDGSMLNSGVYFYKLVTNGFTETKKMLLIK